MDNKQIAVAYSTAKLLGCEKSIDDFKKEIKPIFDETINELNSQPIEPSKVEAGINPFRNSTF